MRTESQQRIAAYVPFKTFLTALETLDSGGVPKQIDRKIWRSFSGLVQGQVVGAFRFLGLVEGGAPTPDLRRLVEEKEDRPAVLRSILERSYSALVSHDLTKMTGTMLDELMENYSVSGATKRKAVTFFLQAAKYAKLPLSRFLLSQTRSSAGLRRKKKTGARGPAVNGGGPSPPQSAPNRGNTKTIDLKNGVKLSLTVSADLFAMAAEDRKFLLSLVEKLEEYEGRGSEAETS
jgi:hypothetical protein